MPSQLSNLPAPFAAMVLADMGAEVLRVDRVGGGGFLSGGGGPADVLGRSRKSASINIKDPRGVEAVLDLVEEADGFVLGTMQHGTWEQETTAGESDELQTLDSKLFENVILDKTWKGLVKAYKMCKRWRRDALLPG